MLNLLGRMIGSLMHKWNWDEYANGGAQPFFCFIMDLMVEF
jgi:hypothetical protein